MSENNYIYKIGTPEFDSCKCQELYKQGKFVGGACGCKICDDCGRWYTCFSFYKAIEFQTHIFLKESK